MGEAYLTSPQDIQSAASLYILYSGESGTKPLGKQNLTTKLHLQASVTVQVKHKLKARQ